jgi:ABC-type amino acid transport substrate-binding protein
MLRLFLLILLVSCGSSSKETLRIGVDPRWYPIDFGPQTSYVNGFTEDLLLEMARYTGIQFEKIGVSWDNLTEGLRKGQYEAILTSMEPYEYHKEKYDFSSSFLDLGPVLIVPKEADQTSLSHFKGDPVGVVGNGALILEKYPQIIIRNFNSIPELLNAVAEGSIQGALLEKIPAINYVSDLYANELKIVGEPLNQAGLRLMAPKNRHAVAAFNRGLEALKKKKSFETLLKKWNLL